MSKLELAAAERQRSGGDRHRTAGETAHIGILVSPSLRLPPGLSSRDLGAAWTFPAGPVSVASTCMLQVEHSSYSSHPTSNKGIDRFFSTTLRQEAPDLGNVTQVKESSARNLCDMRDK